jgi:hypothetical protein
VVNITTYDVVVPVDEKPLTIISFLLCWLCDQSQNGAKINKSTQIN